MNIKRSLLTATMLSAAAALLATTPVAAKTCVMAGGEATMITRDLAEFMAKAALGNSIKGKGMTASGPIKLKCNDPSPLTYCIATQKACK